MIKFLKENTIIQRQSCCITLSVIVERASRGYEYIKPQIVGPVEVSGGVGNRIVTDGSDIDERDSDEIYSS